VKIVALAAFSAVAVAIPASAAGGTGTGTGGAKYEPEQQGQEQQEQRATAAELQRADFRSFRATWYGPGLYGNRTACGQTLTHSIVGVAHKKLRCGTRVAVSYRGKTIITSVIDRGPFARGIEFDLTAAAAKRLGMTQTSRVRAATLRR
jgi:rare lipoprotein A (peptidoglycan hydrolase)